MRAALFSTLTLFTLLLLHVTQASAASYYWHAAVDEDWHKGANWTDTPGGGGTAYATPPGSSDIVFFTNNVTSNCTLSAAVDVIDVTMMGYTGTVVCGSNNVTLSGSFTQDDGTFESTSQTFEISDDMTVSGGTFNHNNGFVRFSGPSNNSSRTITGTISFYDLRFHENGAPGVGITLPAGTLLTVNNNFSVTGNNTIHIESPGNGTIDCVGPAINFTNNNSASGFSSTATIRISGALATQTLTGSGIAYRAGGIGKLEIDKSAGTLNLSGLISTYQNWTHISGNVDPGTSTVYFRRRQNNITVDGLNPGTTSFYNVYIATSLQPLIFTIIDEITVENDLVITGSDHVSVNGGDIQLFGDLTSNFTKRYANGTSTIHLVDPTLDQTITGHASILGNGILPNITIDKSGGDVYFQDFISIKGDFTVESVDNIFPSGSTVGFGRNSNLKILNRSSLAAIPFDNLVFANFGMASVINIGDDVDLTELQTTGTISMQNNVTVRTSATLGNEVN